MTIIRTDAGPGGWIVVWSMGGGAPMVIPPERTQDYVVASMGCRSHSHPHLPENCPTLACQVAAAVKRGKTANAVQTLFDAANAIPQRRGAPFDEELLPTYARLRELATINKLNDTGSDEVKALGCLCCSGSRTAPGKTSTGWCRHRHHDQYWVLYDHLRDERIIR